MKLSLRSWNENTRATPRIKEFLKPKRNNGLAERRHVYWNVIDFWKANWIHSWPDSIYKTHMNTITTRPRVTLTYFSVKESSGGDFNPRNASVTKRLSKISICFTFQLHTCTVQHFCVINICFQKEKQNCYVHVPPYYYFYMHELYLPK